MTASQPGGVTIRYLHLSSSQSSITRRVGVSGRTAGLSHLISSLGTSGRAVDAASLFLPCPARGPLALDGDLAGRGGRLPAASVARTERTTLAFPRLIALRSLSSAFFESLSLDLRRRARERGRLRAAQDDGRCRCGPSRRRRACTARCSGPTARAAWPSARAGPSSRRRVSFGAVLSRTEGTAGPGGAEPVPVAGAASSSAIVTVAPAGEPRLAPPRRSRA